MQMPALKSFRLYQLSLIAEQHLQYPCPYLCQQHIIIMPVANAVNEDVWDGHYRSLKEHLETHGTYPPSRSETVALRRLNRWVHKQRERRRLGRMSSRRIELLDRIDFDWGHAESSIRHVDSNDLRISDADASEHATLSARPYSAPPVEMQMKRKKSTPPLLKVNIPAYYKDVDPKYNGADDEKNETDGGDDEKCTESAHATNPNSIEDRTKNHKEFIAALERYGSKSGSEDGTLAWHAMASALKWPMKDVKVHAYSYFKALTEGTIQSNNSRRNEVNKQAAIEMKASHTISWTSHELVLLDTLMLKYCSSWNMNIRETPESISSWEKVAANFPGKTPDDCYQMGLSRASLSRYPSP